MTRTVLERTESARTLQRLTEDMCLQQVFESRCQQKSPLYTYIFCILCMCLFTKHVCTFTYIHICKHLYGCIFWVLCLQAFYTCLTYSNEFTSSESGSGAGGSKFITMPSDFCAVSCACENSHQNKSLPEFMTHVAADCSKKQPLNNCQQDQAQDELPAHTYRWLEEMLKGFGTKCLHLIKTRWERKRSN